MGENIGDVFTPTDTFDIKWTNRNETIASMIGDMYANEEQLDLTITVDGDKKLAAHRIVMGIVSPTIMKLLEQDLDAEKNFITAESEGKFIHSNAYKSMTFGRKAKKTNRCVMFILHSFHSSIAENVVQCDEENSRIYLLRHGQSS